MLIFGSIGLFVKNINLSSSEIALLRGAIGSLFLISMSFLIKQKLSIQSIKKNIVPLCLSGAAIGFNWIFLFQSYRYTTISNATLSYYFAPIIVMILSPFILKEKLTAVKAFSIITAMIGLFLLVNIDSSQGGLYNHSLGIFYGLLAAAFYASIIIINKFIKNLSGFETTVIQLVAGTLVLLPYVVFRNQLDFSEINSNGLLLILIIGIIHTGGAYFLYFTSFKELKAQTIAGLSYIDPISAVIMAAIILGESMSLIQIVGGILILGSTFLSEKWEMKAQKECLPSAQNDRNL